MVEVPVDRPVGLLADPPPAQGSWDVVLGGEGDCPPAYAACLAATAATAIDIELSALRAYARRAYSLCRPPEPTDAGVP